MVLLTFRLTDDDATMLESAVNFMRITSVVYIAVHETSRQGQKHIHVMFEPVKIDKSAWVQKFHKFFHQRWVGNSSYSCTPVKEKDNFILYCCKGTRFKPAEIIFKNDEAISDEKVKECYDKYWSDKPIEEDKTLLQKPKKSSTVTWSEQLTKDLLKSHPNEQWRYDATTVNFLINSVLKNLGQTSKKLNSFIVRDIVFGQLNALSGGKCEGLNKKIKYDAFPDLFGEH